jgi:FemAB-related protein (PEP-CTERM system-associated)
MRHFSTTFHKGVTVEEGILQIAELSDDAFAAWDRYVTANPAATFFHRAGWKRVIEKSFGHRTHYLYAKRDGAIEGVLPLVHMKHPIFGHSLISVAFGVYGGPVASNAVAENALDARARALAANLDVDYLEYRQLQPKDRPGFVANSELYATFRKALEPSVDQNLFSIPRKQRAMVRKGLKFGLQSEIDSDPNRLHKVYATSVRNLGTPVFARRYFEELKREFKDECEILLVVDRGRAVAGVMSFYFRDEVLPYYGGGTREARDLAANDVMYWEVMRRACERGSRIFDFGRSKVGTGSYQFKKNWGFPAMPLHYLYQLRRGEALPALNPLNPKFRLFIAIWKRLPLAVANRIGPHIVRHIG